MFFSQCVSSEYADVELNRAIYYSDINKLQLFESEGSCEASNYLALLRGNNITPEACISSNKSVIINILIAEYSTLLSSGEFLKAKLTLLKLAEVTRTDYSSELDFINLNEKSTFYGSEKHLEYGKDFKIKLFLNGELTEFTIDSGALFSVINENSLNGSYQRYAKFFKSAFGKEISVEYSLLDVSGFGKSVFLIHNTESVLGHNILSKIDLVKSISYSSLDSKISYFKDGANVFLNGIVEMNGNFFLNKNICLDTGGESSFITSKFYKEVRSLIKNTPVKKLVSMDIAGNSSLIAREASNINIKFNGTTVYIKKIPAVFHGDLASTCDIVLARDILKERLTAIDFRRNIIFLRELAPEK